MNTAERRSIDNASSPSPPERCCEGLERWQEESGLIWPGLEARIGINDRAALFRTKNPDRDTEEELPMSFDNDNYEPSLSKGYPPPPLPEDWWVRLGRLEDRTGVSLEDFPAGGGCPWSGPTGCASTTCPPPPRCGPS